MSILDNDTQVSVLVEGLDHPEGIAWDSTATPMRAEKPDSYTE